MMTPELWARVAPVLDDALAQPDGEREAYIRRVCDGDDALAGAVRRILRLSDSAAGGVLDHPALELAAPLLDPAGTIIRDRYEVIRTLGTGGMGIVFLARDRTLDRLVALKFLPAHLAGDPAAIRRFQTEARAVSALDHPHIGVLYDIARTDDGQSFMVMAYYDGDTLRARIAGGRIPPDEALDLAAVVADALAAAHAAGIVHRDVKPSNILLARDGGVRLLDFGIARMAGEHEPAEATAGTMAYMSPEQTRGEAIDHRTDIWSLGIVLYEMLAGRHPFRGRSDAGTIDAIRHEAPPPLAQRVPDLPDDVHFIVARCLEKEAQLRYASATELRDDLRAAARRLEAPPPAESASRWRAAGAAGLLAAAVAGAYLIDLDTRPAVVAEANRIAVLPFTPAGPDTALARLGRELAVTVGASLDGIGGIRTVEPTTVLALVPAGEAVSLERAAGLAGRMQALSIVHGSLTNAEPGLRVDLGVYDARSLRVLGRTSVTGSADDIVGLTDSASLALLRQLWRRGRAPAPSLAAIRTGSLTALRFYLEGEQALARAEFGRAIAAFEQAYAEDTTFHFAYWRSLYPRVYEGAAPDSAVLRKVLAHRNEFPAADRMLVESWLEQSVTGTRKHLQDVTRRFPDYWPAWYSYANLLVHQAPYLGSSYDDARSALERVVALNPALASGWQHLFWIAVHQRDTAAAARALESLTQLGLTSASYIDAAQLSYYRALYERIASGAAPEPVVRSGASGVARMPPPAYPELFATGMLQYGFPREQIRFSLITLGHQPRTAMAAAQTMGLAFAWAQRGAWDSALVYAQQWTRLDPSYRAALVRYGLAVTGVRLGALEAHAASVARPDPRRAVPPPTATEVAELAWQNGVFAYALGDTTALTAARRQLLGLDTEFSDLLHRSLASFALDATGHRDSAAKAMAALEWESGEARLHERYGGFHPFVNMHNRLAAAEWLQNAGDTSQAARLLTWHEAVLWSDFYRSAMVNKTVEPLVLLQRARIDDALGRTDRAIGHYLEFLDRYDRPVAAHRGLVEEARRALSRLSPPG